MAVGLMVKLGRICGSDGQNQDQCISDAQIPSIKS